MAEQCPQFVVGILLAAGRSTRFGSDKLAHRLTNGLSILESSAKTLSAGVDLTRAVIRCDQTPLTARLSAIRVEAVVCPGAEAGMGVSLACGVAASRDADGWIVYLADMPFVRVATVAAVADCLRRGALIAAPVCNGRRGHPVGFGAHFRDELLACSGDSGARRILAANAALVEQVPVEDSGILNDIDRPRDLNCR